MYEFSPMTERVKRVRERYRSTVPFIDTARYRIVTEFYQQHGEITGILKRAMNFRNLCAAARAAWRESFPLEGRDVARWFPGHMAKGEARRGALLPRLLAGPALGGLVS